jgi:hypothetical protein
MIAAIPRSEHREGVRAMCMNCGCGEPEKRHQPTDITKDDLQKAADGSGISIEEASRNLRASLDKVEQPTSSTATS